MRSAAKKIESDPSAESACADDCDVRLGGHPRGVELAATVIAGRIMLAQYIAKALLTFHPFWRMFISCNRVPPSPRSIGIRKLARIFGSGI
jgi:hypothetical protein